MKEVILYTKEKCKLCDDAEALLSLFDSEFPHRLVKRDIYQNEEWLERYHLSIPVVEIGDRQLYGDSITYSNLYDQFMKAGK